MLQEEDNDAFDLNASDFNMKKRIKADKNSIYSISSSENSNDNTFQAPEYNSTSKENIQEYTTEHYFNAVNDRINLHKGSFAHNLHPNIEVLANSLLDKLDTLQRTQLDIHHVEMITDRAFHSVEKLKYEIKEIHDYIQKIESRNKNLENKLDLLITQNEAINKQNTQLQALCQNFFSLIKDNNLYKESKSVNYKLEPKNEYEATYTPLNTNDDVSIYKTTNINDNKAIYETNTPDNEKLHSSNINSSSIKDKREIKHLLKSKKQIETFIKKNYPDDYLQIKQYKKVNIFNWVNRVLGSN